MTLHAWSTKWLVNLNPQKTETMTISRKLNKPHQPNLIMNNTIISTVTEHKHLGLQLSDDGNWNKHIDMITKKAFFFRLDSLFLLNHNTYRYRDMKICTLFTIYTDRS